MNPEDKIVTTALEKVRSNLKKSECLLPTFFVGTKDNMQIIGTPFDDDDQKDAIASFIKKKAEEMGAEFILFIAESWTIRDQIAAREFMDNRDIYPSVSSHPKAIEVVMLSLETKNKVWSAVADILPGRVMGEVSWMEPKEMGGRFANFLGEKPTLQ